MHLPGFGLEHSLDWPRIELAETDQQWKVTAELPGFEPSDLQVFLTDRMVTIQGEKHLGEHLRENFPGAEQFFGRFVRRIPLPGTIKKESVTAIFNDGLLSVVMLKGIARRPKRIAVDDAQ